MDPNSNNTQVRVKHCSLCQGDTEYYCHDCTQNLCLQCKYIHVIDIDTEDHEVTRYAEKTKLRPIKVMRARSRDPDNHEPRGIPVSDPNPEHIPWRFLPPLWFSPLEHSSPNGIKRHLYSRIHYLRGEILYHKSVLLDRFRHYIKNSSEEVTTLGQSKAEEMARKLKDLIDEVLTGNLYDRCQIQKTRLSKLIDRLEKYERRYEQYSCRLPVEYLRFIKHKPDPRKNEQKLIKILVQMMKRMKLSTETSSPFQEKLLVGNEHLLTLMPSPVLRESITVNDVKNILHFSFFEPDKIWVSGKETTILADTTTGAKLYSVEDSSIFALGGSHTVNSECELIYIDKDNNINKLSSDMKTTTTFIQKPEAPWEHVSVYRSPFTNDLLVGMCRRETEKGPLAYRRAQVMRYNNTGKRTQTIPETCPHDSTPSIYLDPLYITENNNGDVVVSDSSLQEIVVTEREGRYRFSFRGHSSGSPHGIAPRGICTDVLSHILFYDARTNTVHMISKDGEFLKYLLTGESPGMYDLLTNMIYDVKTHLLWVGFWRDNKVSIYRYINRHLTITDKIEVCDDVSVCQTSPSQSIPGYSQLHNGGTTDIMSEENHITTIYLRSSSCSQLEKSSRSSSRENSS